MDRGVRFFTQPISESCYHKLLQRPLTSVASKGNWTHSERGKRPSQPQVTMTALNLSVQLQPAAETEHQW